MAWTTPRTWVAGELVTELLMNTYIRDNQSAIVATTGAYVNAVVGPHAIGGSTNDYTRMLLDGAFSSGGASTHAYGLHIDGGITGHSADSGSIVGTKLDNNIVRAGACTTIAQLWVSEPTITGSGTVTNSATGYIQSAATEATNDYALWVDDGATKLDGTLVVGGDVGIGVTPTGGRLALPAAETSTPVIRLENDQSTVDGSIDSWTSTSNIQMWIGANEYLNGGSPARFNTSYDTGAIELQAGYVILRTGSGATSSARLTVDPAGAVAVAGALSKGSGSFKIDHPLPSKSATHHLVHSFAESPETLLIYRGSVTLVAGQATVDLDAAAGMSTGTWALLCREAQCFTTNETGWHHVRGSVSGSTLTINCEEECDDVVSWMVVANRQDTHILSSEWTDEDGRPIVEPEKPEEEGGA